MLNHHIDEALAWGLLLELLQDDTGPDHPLQLEGDGWRCTRSVAPKAAALFDLYASLCRPGPWSIAHLGQSLDGRIATESGHSCYVTGPENLDHLHRMRALADAVLVGAGTVAADDPQLTTRRVPGDSPVRVILDPQLRLAQHLGVFQDQAAPTLVFCAQHHLGGTATIGQAPVVGVPEGDGGLSLTAIGAELQRRGLKRLFVEGGGITVSRFLAQGLLDRLQIAIAPLIIGSGRQGLNLPAIDTLEQGLRPRHRWFAMGEDILWDCQFERQS